MNATMAVAATARQVASTASKRSVGDADGRTLNSTMAVAATARQMSPANIKLAR